MKRILFFVMLALVLTGMSCKSMREKKQEKNGGSIPSAILVENMDEYRDNADFTITAVGVEGNIMTIDVQYSGGCQKHEFTLIGMKAIQKSLPPKRGVILFHNSNGDNCRSIVEEKLQFDISVLAYEGGEIILNLDTWATPISYTKTK
ncbi:MAG: hypothetical protein JNJ99_09095 [Crocinitomicaceae bacterium]|nr:hypothetical protein [Crocinitomicaceae bacterium]